MYLKTALLNTRVFQNTTKHIPTLSVERRFTPTKESIVRLTRNDDKKPFLKHVYLGRRVLKESYILDKPQNDKHASGRYLIRARNGHLEAKVETFGIGKGAVFTTIYERTSVESLSRPEQELDDLEPTNWMRTIREEWELDGINIAIDHTLFGSWLWGKAIYPQKPFCIGKVQLSEDLSTVPRETRKSHAQKMDRKLDEFLKQHERIFLGGEGEVHGKLEAFNDWLRDHVKRMSEGFKTTDEWQKQGMYDDLKSRPTGPGVQCWIANCNLWKSDSKRDDAYPIICHGDGQDRLNDRGMIVNPRPDPGFEHDYSISSAMWLFTIWCCFILRNEQYSLVQPGYCTNNYFPKTKILRSVLA
jgi:hypothetical protein